MIPDSFKQDLLNRVDIVEVVGKYVQLRKAGANYSGLCPFHNEKTPSFSVSPSKQFFHCFGCQKHGNAIGFLIDYAGLGYVDAIKELASTVGMQVPEWQPRTPEEAKRKERETDLGALMQKAMAFYRAQLKKSPRAVDYLKRRGLSGETAARYGVGYAPDDWQGLKQAFPEYEDAALVECGLVIEGEGKRYDRFRDRVMFPIFNRRDAVVGFGGRVLGEGEPKYLNSPETPLFQKGQEIYGLGHARESIHAQKRALVVEGYMDVLALAQHGIGYAVATLGTATTPVHVTRLMRELRESGAELVFCFDGDAAGRKAAWRALEVCLPLATDNQSIKFLFLPEADDPDSYVRKQGKTAFEALIATSQTLSSYLVERLKSESELNSAEGRATFLSRARPFVSQITAPMLRVQILSEVADLGRISQDDLRRLLGEERRSTERPRSTFRPSYRAPNSLEWELLKNVLANIQLVEQVDAELLTPGLPESEALVAIANVLRAASVTPTFAMVVEILKESPHMEIVLQAGQYSSDLNFDQDQSKGEFADALVKLELARQRKALDALLARGLHSTQELTEYQAKLTVYKRLQGALPTRSGEEAGRVNI